jgi:hypothetical protein
MSQLIRSRALLLVSLVVTGCAGDDDELEDANALALTEQQ